MAEKAKQAVEDKVEDQVDETADSPLGTEEQEEQVKEEDFVPKTDDEGEEESTSSDSEEDAPSEDDDGTEEQEELDLQDDDLSLDDFEDDKPEKKSGVQKRIDKLTAEKKALEERLDKLESNSTKKDKEYSDTDLRRAMAKALEDQDPNLMWEIMEYRIKKEKQSVLEAEKKKQEEYQKKQQKVAQEWHSTVEEYQYLSEEGEPELYKGSHKDLNIKDQNSLLIKLANKLYQDPQKAERYRKDGGQRLAVSDAIKIILRKKNTKTSSKENQKLKRKLAKEKRKSSVSSGKAVKKESSSPKQSGNKLEDYLNDRKTSQAKARGGF